MTIQEIEKGLARKGLSLENYKPGRDRLYRVVKEDRRGTITKTLSQFLTASELKNWYNGFTASRR